MIGRKPRFALIDHGKRDGINNLITITGGKLMTYRLMSEKASDLICEKIGKKVSCSTLSEPSPGCKQTCRLKRTTSAILNRQRRDPVRL